VATSAAQIAKTGKFGDLRRRLVFLLLALVVYRMGAHIPVPGIDPNATASSCSMVSRAAS
jgi:preprotein translocase subunit SecY